MASHSFQKGVIISKERAGLCIGMNNIIYSLLPAICETLFFSYLALLC